MEQKINIAEILKDKQQGTKLYDLLRNIEVELDSISHTDYENIIWCRYNDVDPYDLYGYSTFGTERGWLNGFQILLPSKEIRDWNKFAWKKGDLLINSCGFQCIFKEWVSNDYTKFNGCYSNSRDGYEDVSNAETAKFVKLDNNTTYGYIREIERKLGGKLNLKTLEIEKQPEFKNGDIIKMTWDKYSAIAIFWKYSNFGKGFDSHVFFNIKKNIIEYNIHNHTLQDMILRLATEEEKQQLFLALTKKGKYWDAKKKQIVDLKPKVDELKPFDKVVVRCGKSDKWSIDFFSYKVSDGYICAGDAWFGYCLTYNEETAKLIGTTKDMEI